MRFVIIDIAQAKAHGIEIIPTMRQSIDRTKVVLHEEYIQNIDVFNALQRYEFDSAEFTELMNSEEWFSEDMEQPNEDYAKVKAMKLLTSEITTSINTMKLSNKEAVECKEFYPKWETFVGKSLDKGVKFQYKEDLYEVIQTVSNVLEHQTPDLVPANYGLVSEHDGTQEDPIPYVQMMLIRKDKYYTQNGKLYVGIMDAPNGYAADLDSLPTLVKEVK